MHIPNGKFKKFAQLILGAAFLWWGGFFALLGHEALREDATTPYIKDPVTWRPDTTALGLALILVLISAVCFSKALKKPAGPFLMVFVAGIAICLLILPKI